MRNRFAAVYKLELRMICLHWSYWVLLALFALWTISTFSSRSFETAESLLLSAFPINISATGSLAMMVMAAIVLSRAQRNRIQVLEQSFPTGSEVLIGRWSAVMTAMAIMLLVPIAMTFAAGPFSEFIANLPVFLLETLLVFGLSAALTAFISITIGINRWVYPLFALVWLGSALIPASLNTKLFPWSLLLSFTANGWSGYSYSMVWGRLAEGAFPAMVHLTYIGALVLLLSVVLWKITRERTHRFSPILTIIAILSLGLVIIGAVGYSAGIQTVNARDDESSRFMADKNVDYFTLPADMLYAPTRYDLTLDLSSFDKPTFALQMDITNRGNEPLTELAFSLNHQLDITKSNIPFERDYDYVRLLPEKPLAPGETLTVNMTYQGSIWWYGNITQGRPPQAEDFIKAEGINLNCAIAWYPIPGSILVGRTLFYPDRLTPDCLLSQPVAFSLHVQYAGDLQFASNLSSSDAAQFASPAVTWVQLMASPKLVTENIDPVNLITIQTQLDLAHTTVQNDYLPTMQQLQQFYPDIHHLNLFVLDSGFSDDFFGSTTPATADDLTVVVDPLYVSAFPRSPSNRFLFTEAKMVASLFGQGNTQLAENVAYFLHAYNEGKGDAVQIQTLLKAGIPQGEAAFQIYYSVSDEERYSIAYALNDIYQQQGEAVLKALLQDIRANANTLSSLSNKSIIEWMNTHAH